MPPVKVDPDKVREFATEAGRKKKIATFVEMLKRGETPYQQGKKRA